MFDVEGKWPNKVEQTGSTLGLSEIRTADTPPVHDNIHRQGASFSPLIHSQSHKDLMWLGSGSPESLKLWRKVHLGHKQSVEIRMQLPCKAFHKNLNSQLFS